MSKRTRVIEPPKAYLDDTKKMLRAAIAWRRAHPSAVLLFAPWPAGVGFIAALPDTYDWWPTCPEALELLKAMDAASGMRATALQAKAVLDHIR